MTDGTVTDDRERADAVYAALLDRAGEQWVQPRRERTARLLDLLDNPQHTTRVVHITGTNGKTSTARMIESLIRAHGLRTGLFTSPHLARFTERIRIDGAPAADAAIADAWDEIEPFVAIVDAELRAQDDARLTFFELLTVLCFVVAADAPVDVLVLEVGMGGSWDSTNTADGDVAVFTPIDLDHTHRLGQTRAAIAAIKAGIIKEDAAVVSARQGEDVADVLKQAAAELAASIAFEGDSFAVTEVQPGVGGQVISVRGRAGHYDDLVLPLFGAHQAENAALAIAAVESLIGGGAQPIAHDVVADGLRHTTSPGRLQVIGSNPLVVVDAAHNPHGAHALAAALPDAFDVAEWGVVLGVLAEKDLVGIARALTPIAAEIFLTVPDSDRAGNLDAAADVLERSGIRASVHPDLDEAASLARRWALEGEHRGVVIAGSVVLAGEALTLAAEDGWRQQ